MLYQSGSVAILAQAECCVSPHISVPFVFFRFFFGALASMPLVCPSVLELTYFRRGCRHRLFIGITVEGGDRVCGLRIQGCGWPAHGRYTRQWSGWHGYWQYHVCCDLQVWLHYFGNTNRARWHTFTRIDDWWYVFVQQGETIWMSVQMVTLLMTQQQLEDQVWIWL